jgi:hypothetical protein
MQSVSCACGIQQTAGVAVCPLASHELMYPAVVAVLHAVRPAGRARLRRA